MIGGSCLCGGVRFEFEQVRGAFELCHCKRCRKRSGSAFLAMLEVDPAGFRFLAGAELIRSYEAPILRRAPAYRTNFCSVCGCPVPDPEIPADFFEVPAGCLDDDPGCVPDRHICVDRKAPWLEIGDELPQLDMLALHELRVRQRQAASAVDASSKSSQDSDPAK